MIVALKEKNKTQDVLKNLLKLHKKSEEKMKKYQPMDKKEPRALCEK